MSLLKVGIAESIGGGRVPVLRVLARNASLMTGPGTNSYLLGTERLALVDPGPADPLHIETLLEILEGRPLDWIFVTHTHSDHAPGAALLQARTGARIVGLAAPAAVSGAGYHDQTFVPARLYRDGEVIDCGEFQMHLLHTPGHASNHLCFHLEEEGMLFTGDHILEGTTPVILPPDGNMGHYLDSLRRLQLLSLGSLAPGHGHLLEDPQTVIATLIRHRLRREAKVLTALLALNRLAGHATLEELTPEVYDDVSVHLWPWAQRTLLAHLLKLEEDGRVEREGEHWHVFPVGASQDATNHDS
ncbi:MAG: MBL fold metallo-hydrolase [Gammaproteobacteria bacterium]|nr:MBL fold metallo-hydrolase [Gammaproteobacteria bacterium]